MRRLLIGLAAAGCLIVAKPLLAVTIDTDQYPRCEGGDTFTCEDTFIESFDGVPLDATLYVPTSAGPSSRVPAILMTHGYGGWHRGGGDRNFQKLLAGQGYVVLGYTSRGFGRSGGSVQLQSPDWEVRDAQALITWLADPDNTGGAVKIDNAARSDPRIGMVGGSYAGGIQLLAASYDSRLDAIVPQITWNDLRYSLSPNGVVKDGWIDLLYASGKYSGYFGPLPSASSAAPPPVVGTDGVPADQDVQILTSFLTNDNVEMPIPYSDGSRSSYEYLKRRSPVWEAVVGSNPLRPVIDDIRTPTLLIQGQQDTLFRVNEAIANRDAIADNRRGSDEEEGVPTKLVVFSGGHGYSDLPGERDAINARVLTWFQRYLRRDNSANTGPAVEVWQPWVSGANFAGLDDFPAATTPVALATTSATLANLIAPTSHSEVTNFQPTTGSPSVDLAEGVTAADLAGPVATSPVTIAGIPVLTFTITATAPEAIVFAKLYDEDASGARTLIHHLVTPARIRAGQGDFCTQGLPGVLSATPVTAVSVCLPLAGIVWQVAPGHHLVLTLATSDTMYFGSRFPAVYEISDVSLTAPML